LQELKEQVRDIAERKRVLGLTIRPPEQTLTNDKFRRMKRQELEKVIEDAKGREDRQLLRWTMVTPSDDRETRTIVAAQIGTDEKRAKQESVQTACERINHTGQGLIRHLRECGTIKMEVHEQRDPTVV
jgi:hypothetical protein